MFRADKTRRSGGSGGDEAPPAPAPAAALEGKGGEDGYCVTLHNLSYDTKRYDLKEHVKTVLDGGFDGRLVLFEVGLFFSVAAQFLLLAEDGALHGIARALHLSVTGFPFYAGLAALVWVFGRVAFGFAITFTVTITVTSVHV